MNALVWEFFFPVIARIPPGLLVIVLYWRKETENVFNTHSIFFSSPLLFIACVLAIAWAIGMVVEQITYYPIVCFLKLLSRHFRLKARFRKFESFRRWVGLQTHVNDPKPQGADRSWEREKRRQHDFGGADLSMSRGFSAIFFLALIKPPEPFANLQWNRCLCFEGFCAFLLVWCVLKVNQRM
jgi:hypothetical protein